ncbi:MAG: EAL domain-containing protein [Motiliproteus sp.]
MTNNQQPSQLMENRLRTLDVLDRITQISLKGEGLDAVLNEVLELILDTFNADRAWFLYPCDPEADSWKVPFERTRPQWPGLLELGTDIAMEPDVSQLFEGLLTRDNSRQYSANGDHQIPEPTATQFSIKSQLQIALRPKTGSAWVMGLHHCEAEIIHNKQQQELFDAIAYRISDTLDGLISVHQLRSTQANLDATLNAVPDLLFEWGLNGFIYNYNSSRDDLLAVSPMQFLGRTLSDVLPGEAANICLEALQEANQSGTSAGRQYPLEVNGEPKWFELSIARKAQINPGQPRFIALIHDITQRKLTEDALRASEQFAKTTIDAVPEHICVIDSSAKVIAVNHSWREFYRHNINTPIQDNYGIGKNYLTICQAAIATGSAEAALMEQGIRRVMTGKQLRFTLEYHCDSSTELRIYLATVTRFHGDSGNLLITHEDITELKQAQNKQQLAASVFTHAREGIFITDHNGIIIETNEIFSHITGYSREEALGQNPRFLQSGQQDDKFYTAMWQSLDRDGHWSGEIWNTRKNGDPFAEMLTISAVRDSQSGRPQNYVALFTDITVMKQHEQQLEHIAHYDALTNLPNRVLLADRLTHAMAQSQRRGLTLAVAYLDLDGFKPINDRYGHSTGDDLLINLSQRMLEGLREGDTLARIGGDEFVAVVVDLDQPEDYQPILNRLLLAASEQITIGDNLLRVSASIGVTLYPQDNVDADLLLRHADQAMYSAKQAGKNRFHLFDTNRDTEIKTRHESLQRIDLALKQKEFVLYYQPKVNMKSGAVIGVEALIRWQHPQRGVLLPFDFLPVIDDHTLSIELDLWVIEAALKQISDWQTNGLALQVSVNVGAKLLQHSDFVMRLSLLLKAHSDVLPNRLEIEILETSALEDIAQVSEQIRACQKLGVAFAIDDFGTGYSSLTYLKHLPAETLKIDRSFVHDMLEDADDCAIVEGVIGLAKAFRRKVIAEGVETVAHGSRLLQLGCELAQGYGIAKPMPANQISQWLSGRQPEQAWQSSDN